MRAAIMLNPNTGAYHVAMLNGLGTWSLLVDDLGRPVNAAWEFSNTGFEGVHAQRAMQALVTKFDRVDAIFARITR